MGKCQQEVKQRHGARLRNAEGNDLRIAVEGGDQVRGQDVNADAYEFCKADRADDAEVRAFFGTVVFFCPQVLADEGCQRQRKACDRQKAEAFDLGISAAAGDCHFAEAVDIGLDNDVCQGNDGVLQSGRQAVLDDLL